MMKIKETLFGTLLQEPEKYENRYIFKGKLEDLSNCNFTKLKEKDVIKELKLEIGKEDIVYYKKSGCGYFIIFQYDESIVFMSGVPIWWIGDEKLTDYYNDINDLIKADLVEKVGSNEDN